jgi:hypothetical protein
MRDLFDELPPAAAPARKPTGSLLQRRFAGMSPRELVLLAAGITMFIWGAWVTRNIASSPDSRQEFVQLQLQGIIGEYLQAQSRSSADETTAARETAVFMAALDETVASLSKSGKVVLVHEAIVGGNVPDVTQSVKAAVYAKVPRPTPAQAGPARALGQGMGPGVGPKGTAANAARVEAEMQAFMAANGGGQGGGAH